jgi:hypothetical protein
LEEEIYPQHSTLATQAHVLAVLCAGGVHHNLWPFKKCKPTGLNYRDMSGGKEEAQ